MDEELIFFMAGDIKIEGLLQTKPGDKGVVITHPHPLYGGSMHNNVVESLVQVYQQAGYATLRFNFRGVGGSAGQYDNGVGEVDDLVQDRVDVLGFAVWRQTHEFVFA